MKYASAILSIYLFALAVLPCADEVGWCVFDLEEAIGVELHKEGDHDHEKECSDHCSPLCNCNCCQMTIRLPIKTNFEIIDPVPVFSDPSSLESLLKDFTFLHDIWQPPKFS